MSRLRFRLLVLLLTLACTGGSACRLQRPEVVPTRMIEPQIVEPTRQPPAPPASENQAGSVAGAAPIRLLDAQARGHIGRKLLHQQSGGELVEDAVWRWSSTPDRYLDSALRLALVSSGDVRLVDTGNVASMAVTLIGWQIETSGRTQLVGVVELVVTKVDRTVHTQLIRGSEPVSAELPGDLAAGAGRLLHTLAVQSLASAARAVR